MDAIYYEYDGKKYYAAETTGNNWKVGDQSQGYISIEPQIISLENYEETTSTEISSKLDGSLTPSSISLSLFPESLEVNQEGTAITISGSISPRVPSQQVTININHESSKFDIYRTVTTDQHGNYSYPWNFNTTGIYNIQTTQNIIGIMNARLTIQRMGINTNLEIS